MDTTEPVVPEAVLAWTGVFSPTAPFLETGPLKKNASCGERSEGRQQNAQYIGVGTSWRGEGEGTTVLPRPPYHPALTFCIVT